jgi:hypothetical protein
MRLIRSLNEQETSETLRGYFRSLREKFFVTLGDLDQV